MKKLIFTGGAESEGVRNLGSARIDKSPDTQRWSSVFHRTGLRSLKTALAAIALGTAGLASVHADETCSSPYLARIEGQEEFVYVWTLGVEGLGDGSDKLVTVDVKPGSPNYGKV